MKRFCLLSLLLFASLAFSSAEEITGVGAGPIDVRLVDAPPFAGLARTDRNTLNDLLEDLPIYSLNREKQIRRLSATQEQLVVFEERMRGKGFPQPLRGAFSIYYSAVLDALVEGRICEEEGREYLSIHRQLLERTELWLTKRVRDEEFDDEVIRNLHYFLTEMEEAALPAHLVAPGLRTPVLNGYQAWVGELLAWGDYCRIANPGRDRLNPGQYRRIEVALQNLERFEKLYKRDGLLMQVERDDLHKRLVELARTVIEELGVH